MLGRLIKNGLVKEIVEELSFDSEFREYFTEKWRFKKLVKRVEELEKKLNLDSSSRDDE